MSTVAPIISRFLAYRTQSDTKTAFWQSFPENEENEETRGNGPDIIQSSFVRRVAASGCYIFWPAAAVPRITRTSQIAIPTRRVAAPRCLNVDRDLPVTPWNDPPPRRSVFLVDSSEPALVQVLAPPDPNLTAPVMPVKTPSLPSGFTIQ